MIIEVDIKKDRRLVYVAETNSEGDVERVHSLWVLLDKNGKLDWNRTEIPTGMLSACAFKKPQKYFETCSTEDMQFFPASLTRKSWKIKDGEKECEARYGRSDKEDESGKWKWNCRTVKFYDNTGKKVLSKTNRYCPV